MKKYIYITLGSLLLSIGINGFLSPFNMVIGGAGGIGIILQKLFSVPLWTSNLALNIPLLFFATFQKGVKYTKNIMVATFIYSLSLGFTEDFVFVDNDIFLATVFGGILTGAGLGLVLKADTTTGGSELLAVLLHDKFKHVTISRLLLYIDAIIIMGGMFILGFEPTMYAIITLYISIKVIDLIVEEIDFAKAAFIICKDPEPVLNAIFKNLQRGATIINTIGSYTQKPNYIVLAVVSKREIGILKTSISESDKNAFVIVTDVREIMGEFNRR